MKSPSPGSRLVFALYRRLLALYPTDFRRRFGDEMQQVFRDQWHAAPTVSGSLRHTRLVGWTLLDLLKSAATQRILALKSDLQMKSPLSPLARLLFSALAALPVFLAILALTISITAALPKVYQSTSRLLVRSQSVSESPTRFDPFALQTEAELLGSMGLLENVVRELQLTNRLATAQGLSAPLTDPDALSLLKRSVLVRLVRNTSLLEVRVFLGDPQLASEIANRIVEVRLRLSGANDPRLSVIDVAEPGLRPVRPNVPLNLTLGSLAAAALAGVTLVAAWLFLGRRRQDPPTPTGASLTASA